MTPRWPLVLLLSVALAPSGALIGEASHGLLRKIKRAFNKPATVAEAPLVDVQQEAPRRTAPGDSVDDSNAAVAAPSGVPNLEALSTSLAEARSWLEATSDSSAAAAQEAWRSNDQLQDVLESCRSLIAQAEAQQQQLVGGLFPSQAPSRTLVGAVAREYQALLPYVAKKEDLPVEMLLHAIETQATHSSQLGTFMQLIVKIDQGNMRTVREAWERHGKPEGLRALLQAEVDDGVQQPTRLVEGSAALSLLWSMRMKRFWTYMADGFADTVSIEPTSGFGIRAYEREVEPYHGMMLKTTFRTALRALPNRETMLGNMEVAPPPPSGSSDEKVAEPGDADLPVLSMDERRSLCLSDLRDCSDATKRVTAYVQSMIDSFELRDDRRL